MEPGIINNENESNWKNSSSLYSGCLPIICNQIDNSLCKIKKKNGGIGTGFICRIPFPDFNNLLPVFITCYHVLKKEDITEGKEIELEFKQEIKKKILINNSRKIYFNKDKYDITIIEIIKEDGFNNDSFLEIDDYLCKLDNLNEIYRERNNIYLIHYPKGLKSKFSVGKIISIALDNYDLEHNCSTDFGSSGGPILCNSNNKVIGFHKGKHKEVNLKKGTALILPIKSFYLNHKKEEENKIQINEITLKVQIKDNEINKKIYFLGNSDCEKYLKELNETNVKIYIKENKVKYTKSFIPIKMGEYKIKIKFGIQMTNCYCMFYNCKNIIKIDLSSFDSRKVTNMSKMFYDCRKLRDINLSSFNTKNVLDMSYIFSGCQYLENINLNSFDTKNVIDMKFMFSDCYKLKNIDISSFDTSNVKDMSWMFNECQNLENINFNFSTFNTKNVKNMSLMFCGCKSLKEINLSFFDTKNVIDMNNMFSFCTNLKNIDLSSFDTRNVLYMVKMFYCCKNLTNLDISHFDTKNVIEMGNIFDYCFELKEIKYDTKNNENPIINYFNEK